MHVEWSVDIQRLEAERVRISTRGKGLPGMDIDGRVVTFRTNFSEFERIDNSEDLTVVSHDGQGNLLIDTVVPGIGATHLVLKRAR